MHPSIENFCENERDYGAWTPKDYVINSPSDITPKLLDDISLNMVGSLTINYDLVSLGEREFLDKNHWQDDYSEKIYEVNNPFFRANQIKRIEKIDFEIKLGANVKDISGLFHGLKDLKKAPLFDTRNVQKMTDMFSDAERLKEVPKYNTSKVTDMSYMFRGARRIKEVPLFATQNVTNMTGMFYFAESLEKVPLFNLSSLEKFDEMFVFCFDLNKETKQNWQEHLQDKLKTRLKFYNLVL